MTLDFPLYRLTSLGLLSSLGVPFLWSVCLNNSYVRSIQWIYTLELEKKSSVTVTFALFVNAQLTFSPVKYPYCVLRRLLSSIQYPNIEEIYINVLVPFIWSVLSLTNYVDILLNDRNFNIQSNNQPSTIEFALMKTHQHRTGHWTITYHIYSFIGRDDIDMVYF